MPKKSPNPPNIMLIVPNKPKITSIKASAKRTQATIKITFETFLAFIHVDGSFLFFERNIKKQINDTINPNIAINLTIK